MRSTRLYVIGIVSLLIGALAFWNQDVQTTGDLIDGFVAIAAIVFGILGAWISILKPVDELDAEKSDKPSNRINVALQIAPALKHATFALAAAVLLRLSLPVVQGLGETLRLLIRLYRPRWDYPDVLTPIFQALVGGSVTFLYLFETVIVILTLWPILSVESTRREVEFYEEEARDPASSYMDSRR